LDRESPPFAENAKGGAPSIQELYGAGEIEEYSPFDFAQGRQERMSYKNPKRAGRAWLLQRRIKRAA